MKSRLPLGRILGFPVDVHVTLLLLLGVVFLVGGGLPGLGLLVLTFASVLAHELGHSVVARRLGVPILGITLYPFGGMARMAAPARSPRDEILIAGAGPAVSLILAVAFGLAWVVSGGTAFLLHVAAVNGLLGVFNLLPALPMDGGRIFRALLARRRGQLGATRIASRVARGIAVLLGLLGLYTNPMLVVIAVMVWFMAGAEVRAAEAEALRSRVAQQPAPDLRALLEDLARLGFVPPGRPEPPGRSPASRRVVEVDPVRS